MAGEGSVTSRYIAAGVTTTPTTQVAVKVFAAPALHSVSNDPGASIIGQYSNYVVRSSKLIYTPAVGTTTTGAVYVAYVDNPEMIYKFYTGAYSVSDCTNIVQNMANGRSAPVWEPMEVSMNRPPRRKTFSVDSNAPFNNESAERIIQGVWVLVTVGAPFSTTVGYVTEEYTAMGENLQPLAFSGI